MEKTKSKVKESKSLKKSEDDLKCLSLEAEKIQTLNDVKIYDNSDYKDACQIQVNGKLFYSYLISSVSLLGAPMYEI